MKSKVYYTIKKTFLKTNQSVLMNNSLGEVLELNDAKTVKLMVETLNSNTDNNCRYSIIERKSNS
tara:strand:- start:3220 stop:3414 length:195 start_codon:yes stop_codon:yes gene_type:complete